MIPCNHFEGKYYRAQKITPSQDYPSWRTNRKGLWFFASNLAESILSLPILEWKFIYLGRDYRYILPQRLSRAVYPQMNHLWYIKCPKAPARLKQGKFERSPRCLFSGL